MNLTPEKRIEVAQTVIALLKAKKADDPDEVLLITEIVRCALPIQA